MLVGGVIVLMTVLVFVILRLALRMGNFLGPTSMLILTRIMGLLTMAIAIEFILDGLAQHFPSLGPIIH